MPWQFSIPEATVERLTRYLATLRRMEREGQETVPSSVIARHAHVNPAQVRKDLSYFGDFGRRGLGYRVTSLAAHITRILGLEQDRRVIVVGAGNLGAALVGYPGFEPRGFHVVGVFDVSPEKIGRRLYGEEILSMERLPQVVEEGAVDIAIVAVPGLAAQAVVDQLAALGIRSILNLAPVAIVPPPSVTVRAVDMTSQLELLSFCLTQPEPHPDATAETEGGA
jgi:redox-sensing transcriptional repressor